MKSLIAILIFSFQASQMSYSQWFWQNPLPQGNTLLDVCFTDGNTGILIGTSGTILRTSDGGEHWINLISGTNNDLRSIFLSMITQR